MLEAAADVSAPTIFAGDRRDSTLNVAQVVLVCWLRHSMRASGRPQHYG